MSGGNASLIPPYVSDRPYRKAMPAEKALGIMKEEAGTKWDPVVVNALSEAVNK